MGEPPGEGWERRVERDENGERTGPPVGRESGASDRWAMRTARWRWGRPSTSPMALVPHQGPVLHGQEVGQQPHVRGRVLQPVPPALLAGAELPDPAGPPADGPERLEVGLE